MSGIVHRFPLIAALLTALLLAAACSTPPPPTATPAPTPVPTATPRPTPVPSPTPLPTVAPVANGTTAPAVAPTTEDDTVYVETPVGLLRNDPGTFPGYTLFNRSSGDTIYLRTAPGSGAIRCRLVSGPMGCSCMTIAGSGSIATPRITPAGKDWI